MILLFKFQLLNCYASLTDLRNPGTNMDQPCKSIDEMEDHLNHPIAKTSSNLKDYPMSPGAFV